MKHDFAFRSNEKILFLGDSNSFLQETLNYLAKHDHIIECFNSLEDLDLTDNTIILVDFHQFNFKFLEEIIKLQEREIVAILLIHTKLKDQENNFLVSQKIDYLSYPFSKQDVLSCLKIHLGYQAKLKQEKKRYELLQTVVDNIPVMLALLNPQYQILWINKAWEEILGWGVEESNEIDFLAHCYPDHQDYQEAKEFIEAANKTWKDFKTIVKNGKTIPTSWTNLKLENGYRIGIGQDITERKEFERTLEESESRFRLITENMRDLVCIHDLESNYIYLSPSCRMLLGYEPEELIGKSPYSLFHPDDQEKKYLENNPITYRIRTGSGEYIWLETITQLILDKSDKPVRMLTASRDVTARIIVEEQFHYTALHNALTDLPNRSFLMQELNVALSEKNSTNFFAVLVIDLDHFKLINDSVGYEVGDQMLIAIGKRLKKLIDSQDFLAHLGGDEFTILLFNLKNQEETFRKTEWLRQQMFLPFNIDGRVLFTSASIGIALSPNYNTGEAILRDAQIATSKAKTLGQGHYQLFDETMYTQVLRRLQLETDLRLAMQRQEFELHYQPIYGTTTNRLVGFEALLRWQSPDGRKVSPDEFIPVTEDTGMIIALGEWVLRESCRQLHQWQLKYPHLKDLSMSVNLSGRQLREQNLVVLLDNILEETECLPEQLKLEITESILIENAEFVAPLLGQLKGRKIQLSLDDFGTGYSSLSYLHRFPVDTLKLDRSFIQRIGEEERDFKIVQAIISLAHKLDMKVIAEGVETEQQFIYLKALECDYIQGYYFAKPLSKKDAEALLASMR